MPPIKLAPWREAARKLAQAVKRQIQQTEEEVAAFLRPGKQVLQREPIPVPRRSGGSLQDRIRQGASQNARRQYTQLAGPPRRTNATGGAAFAQAKSAFGRVSTRPRVNGTLYAHGYRRGFASSSINHAQVAREVFESISLGLRAGVLNIPFYGPPDGREMRSGRVVAGIKAAEQTTCVLRIPLTPRVLAPGAGALDASLVSAVDDVLLSAPKHLAQLRRNLYRLSQFGTFAYKLTDNDTAIQVSFPGRDKESVALFLDDLLDGKGATLGTLTEEQRFIQDDSYAEVDWTSHMYAKQHKLTKSQLSLEQYIQELDVFRATQLAC